MPDGRAATVIHASVVLVSPALIDPQSIRPEALSNAGIIPANWVATGGISIPVVAQAQYQNGFTVQAEGNRCVFQEPINGTLREAYEVHTIAKRYVDATKLVSYNAIGLNWLLELAVENPNLWIREKLMGGAGNFADFQPTSLQVAKQLGFVVCNLNFRGDNRRIVVDCNYHFQLARSSPDLLASTLDSWHRCQEHLTRDLLPQF